MMFYIKNACIIIIISATYSYSIPVQCACMPPVVFMYKHLTE